MLSPQIRIQILPLPKSLPPPHLKPQVGLYRRETGLAATQLPRDVSVKNSRRYCTKANCASLKLGITFGLEMGEKKAIAARKEEAYETGRETLHEIRW